MPSLQVRDMPEVIYRKLAEKAKQEHRSLAQQAVVELAYSLNVQLDNRERKRRILAELADLRQSINVENLPDPTQLIREDRDR